jgi:hypothetical protein
MNQKIVNRFVITVFVTLYLLTSLISTIHVIDFFSLSNPYWLAVALAIGFEVGAAASLASLIVLDKMNQTLVWFLFILLTAMQIMGNVYYAYINLENFQGWVELFGLIEEDLIYQKRILAIVSGGLLPIIALGFIKSLVDYIKPNNEKIEPPQTNVISEVISDKVETPVEESLEIETLSEEPTESVDNFKKKDLLKLVNSVYDAKNDINKPEEIFEATPIAVRNENTFLDYDNIQAELVSKIVEQIRQENIKRYINEKLDKIEPVDITTETTLDIDDTEKEYETYNVSEINLVDDGLETKVENNIVLNEELSDGIEVSVDVTKTIEDQLALNINIDDFKNQQNDVSNATETPIEIRLELEEPTNITASENGEFLNIEVKENIDNNIEEVSEIKIGDAISIEDYQIIENQDQNLEFNLDSNTEQTGEQKEISLEGILENYEEGTSFIDDVIVFKDGKEKQ